MYRMKNRMHCMLCLLVSMTITGSLSSQILQWGIGFGGSGIEIPGQLTCDQQGNVIYLGTYNPPVDFDPGPGSTVLTEGGINGASFMAKYGPNGELIWAHSIPSIGGQLARCDIDAAGNIFFTTTFTGTIDIDPGPDVVELDAAGINNTDILFAKFAPDGTLVWASSIGSSAQDWSGTVAVDGAGNMLVTGTFPQAIDLDPGPGTILETPSGSTGSFFSKFDTDGQLIWSHVLWENNFGTQPMNIGVDGSDNVYLFDATIESVDFDPGPGNVSLTDPVFIAKYDATGALIWARGLPVSNGGMGVSGFSVAQNGHILIAGKMTATVDFDPGPGQEMLASGVDGSHYFARYTTDGELEFARKIDAGTSAQFPMLACALSETGDIYITCHIFQTVDFDPGPGVYELDQADGQGYLAHYDGGGSLVWAFLVESASQQQPYNVLDTGPSGDVWFGGMSDLPVDLDASSGVYEVLSSTLFQYDLYLAKYDPLSTGLGDGMAGNGMLASPNPTEGLVSVRVPGSMALVSKVELRDPSGRSVEAPLMTEADGRLTLDMGHLAPGSYCVIVQDRLGATWHARVVRR